MIWSKIKRSVRKSFKYFQRNLMNLQNNIYMSKICILIHLILLDNYQSKRQWIYKWAVSYLNKKWPKIRIVIEIQNKTKLSQMRKFRLDNIIEIFREILMSIGNNYYRLYSRDSLRLSGIIKKRHQQGFQLDYFFCSAMLYICYL